jgi:regulator of protease activity HflC (stomatin/prohibitin superfamily)
MRSNVAGNILGSVSVLTVGGLIVWGVVWLLGSANPYTPAGYVGYVSQGAIFGSAKFLDTQVGPTSYGRTWLTKVVNVSITPYTYDEQFDDSGSAVLAKDSVKVKFAVHVIWKVRNTPEGIRQFVEQYSTLQEGDSPDKIVKTAYENFLREPIRTSARNELQQFEALKIKDNIIDIGKTVEKQTKTLCQNTPFEIIQVVVGNIQYPEAVANAVAEKMATTQKMETAELDAKRRIAEAEGIAKSMTIIQEKLTPAYVQYLAVEAQKAMVGSPNHTTIYIPVGPMGVPIVNTIPGEPKK